MFLNFTKKNTNILNQTKKIVNQKGSKDFYRILGNHKADDKTIYSSSSEKSLNITVSKDMWKQIFQVCLDTVKDNALVWMQYSILYKILGTNDLLFKIKSHDNGKCSFCKQCT